METETDFLNKQESVFEKLKQFISEIIEADVAEEEELNITKDNIFTKDLEMDSIEIVAFAEKIKNYYGKDIDFTDWLSNLDLDELINLSLATIISFIFNATLQQSQIAN